MILIDIGTCRRISEIGVGGSDADNKSQQHSYKKLSTKQSTKQVGKLTTTFYSRESPLRFDNTMNAFYRQQFFKRLVLWSLLIHVAALFVFMVFLGGRGKDVLSSTSSSMHRRLPIYTENGQWQTYPCYGDGGSRQYCWSWQPNQAHNSQPKSYGDDAWATNDDAGWSHYDDFYHNDDDGTDDGYHDDDYPTDDNHDDDVFVFQPVPEAQIISTPNGGYGGQRGRSLSEIRFNKCPPVIDGYETSGWRYQPSRDYLHGVHRAIFPLKPIDYPVHGEKARILKRETLADSVMTANDYQLHGATAEQYTAELPAPIFPGDKGFWRELRRVAEVQVVRRNKGDPNTVNRWPDLWEGHDLDMITELVHGEYPASLQQELLKQLFSDGVELNYDVMPFRSVNDYVATEVRMSAINTWAVDTIAPISFLLKWNTGVPRPEEVAWLIYNGVYTEKDGVPTDLIQTIQNMNLKHAADFTAYISGSPMHPSWPAMHSAASTCSIWLPVIVKLSPQQYCESLRIDYAVSYARTVAGVHYEQDNLAGLNLGTMVVSEKLPDMLYERYGADPSKVKERLEYLHFDWRDFDPYNCTIEGTPVKDWLG
ncbi:hypothetical protein IV203_019085 [Nitzschia inconspicua]|uniref:Phosphatidic acid phosphatase type 2/haloperoxidase domain-containing protein n=1 Tax=Nitzschia inconspicua TaxID=303405 RepID=A0A9K3LZ68_9STRA|nr:hypothetical protein IV203_019085 [Nitzschia inconspicua]